MAQSPKGLISNEPVAPADSGVSWQPTGRPGEYSLKGPNIRDEIARLMEFWREFLGPYVEEKPAADGTLDCAAAARKMLMYLQAIKSNIDHFDANAAASACDATGNRAALGQVEPEVKAQAAQPADTEQREACANEIEQPAEKLNPEAIAPKVAELEMEAAQPADTEQHEACVNEIEELAEKLNTKAIAPLLAAVYNALLGWTAVHQLTVIDSETAIAAHLKSKSGARQGGRAKAENTRDDLRERNRTIALEYEASGRKATARELGTKYGLRKSAATEALKKGLADLKKTP